MNHIQVRCNEDEDSISQSLELAEAGGAGMTLLRSLKEKLLQRTRAPLSQSQTQN